MRTKSFVSPSRVILLSVLIAIIAGTALLALPSARLRSITPIDLMFTATSSICVTGLMTVPMEHFTPLGHFIIMILMQIGGLGIITLTLFTVSLFTDLGIATQVMAGEMLDLENWSGTHRILLFIILLTLFCEFFGACILFQTLKHDYPFWQACFYSLFQSISAFCNAGIDVVHNGVKQYATSYSMLSTLGALMFLGSLGFMTIRELMQHFNPWVKKKKAILSLQTRIILSYIGGLTIFNSVIFWFLERNNTFSYMSLPYQILNSVFLSISSRSAGFLTVYANDMELASLFTIIINSFIGSAPGSTGSGIKITTAAILAATISATICGNTSVDIKGRRIMQDQIYKTVSVIALSLLWIILVTFCLLITEKSWHFIDIMLEAVAAFTTIGITTGITPYLSIVGKMLIMVSMFVGRIGSLTLLIALRKRKIKQEFSYPQERVMIS